MDVIITLAVALVAQLIFELCRPAITRLIARVLKEKPVSNSETKELCTSKSSADDASKNVISPRRKEAAIEEFHEKKSERAPKHILMLDSGISDPAPEPQPLENGSPSSPAAQADHSESPNSGITLEARDLSILSNSNHQASSNESLSAPANPKFDKYWQDKFQRLIRFKHAHGHTFVPQSYKKDPSLGVWVGNQRMRRSRLLRGLSCGSFSQCHIDLLNSIEFEWDGKRAPHFLGPPMLRGLVQHAFKNQNDHNTAATARTTFATTTTKATTNIVTTEGAIDDSSSRQPQIGENTSDPAISSETVGIGTTTRSRLAAKHLLEVSPDSNSSQQNARKQRQRREEMCSDSSVKEPVVDTQALGGEISLPSDETSRELLDWAHNQQEKPLYGTTSSLTNPQMMKLQPIGFADVTLSIEHTGIVQVKERVSPTEMDETSEEETSPEVAAERRTQDRAVATNLRRSSRPPKPKHPKGCDLPVNIVARVSIGSDVGLSAESKKRGSGRHPEEPSRKRERNSSRQPEEIASSSEHAPILGCDLVEHPQQKKEKDETQEEEYFNRLMNYVAINGGRFDNLAHDDKNKDLADWVDMQQNVLTRNNSADFTTLSASDIARLALLGIIDVSKILPRSLRFEVIWFVHFHELLRWKEKHGHVRITAKNGRKDKLVVWVLNQRLRKKRLDRGLAVGAFTQQHVDLLDSIGFEWVLRSGQNEGMKDLSP